MVTRSPAKNRPETIEPPPETTTEPPGANPWGSPFAAPPSEPVGQSPNGNLRETPTTGRTSLHPESRVPPDGQPSELADAATLTESYSAGNATRRGDPRATAKIIVGLVGVALGLTGWVLYRGGRQLRKPTREQIAEFARPVGAIVARRTDLSWLGADINDLTTAAAVLTDWAADGPIAPPIEPDIEQIGMEYVDDAEQADDRWTPDPTVTYLP